MHFVFCIPLLERVDVIPWGTSPVANFKPLWYGDFLIYVAM